jgi:hypothetical protein
MAMRAAMQLATALEEQRAVSDVLGEGVLEPVRDLGEDALLVDQLHRSQLAQQGVALAADRAQALDEALREVAPDDGGGLQRALRRLRQPGTRRVPQPAQNRAPGGLCCPQPAHFMRAS